MAKKKVIQLAAPGIGRILNTVCKNRKQARLLLADRVANQDAFPDEFVVCVPARIAEAALAPGYFYLTHLPYASNDEEKEEWLG